MKVSELVARRRKNWSELETLCDELTDQRRVPAAHLTRFAALYRAACADLALAESYSLPPNTVDYLERLVGRAHNALYRSRKPQWQKWSQLLLTDAPQTIFRDRCVQTVFVVFWGVFILSAALAYSDTIWPTYAEDLLTIDQIEAMQESFSEPLGGMSGGDNFFRASFYIFNNTGIGLRCFSWGILVVPGLFMVVYNAAVLGASFGYMARPDVPQSANFFEFVTAHGPFELTAIVLSAGAGLRIGASWIWTEGYSRADSLRRKAPQFVPICLAAVVLFLLAALIEGFVSPTSAPLVVKQGIAVVSSLIMAFYFVALGYPRN